MSIRYIKNRTRGRAKVHQSARSGWGSQNPDNKNQNVYSVCPQCGGQLIKKNGKYGQFYSCINFPKCVFACALDEVIVEK